MCALRRKIKLLLLASIAILSLSESAFALCKGSPLNPVTDVCWECMFPARIGGITFGGGEGAGPGYNDSPTCFCGSGASLTIGLSTSFWETARIVETVKDPYCFPSLGTGMGSSGLNVLLAGSQSSVVTNDGANSASQQVHYFIFPVWVLLNLFGDMPCIEKKPFDVAYMTEVDPTWNDDSLSFMLNPEALLFGNPITQLSCMADTVAATMTDPLDPLFWCFGSWGSAYPLSGNTNDTNPITYNAQLAARMVFKLGREGLLWDTANNKCSSDGTLSPIMVKSHYRFQIAKPRRGNDCIPVGRPSFIWGTAKNPPLGGTNSPDNFLWILNRARSCCVGYSI